MLTACEKYEGEEAKVREKKHQGRAGPAQHSMQCGSIADASGHECVMPGAKHRFWCKRSPLTNAMPPVKASASPRLHVETIYGHTQRTDLKWEKKVICPWVRDAQACKEEKSRMDTNVRIQRIWSTTKSNAKLKRQTHFGLNFKLKLSPKIIQKTGPN